jgi:anthranilate synthase component 1
VQVEYGDKVIEQYEGDPLAFIETFQQRFSAPPVEGLPRFTGGLVGYFGYDTIRYVEKRLADTRKPDPIGTPDILLMVSEEMAVVDNLSGKLYPDCLCRPGRTQCTGQGRKPTGTTTGTAA